MIKSLLKKIPGSKRLARTLGLLPEDSVARGFILDLMLPESIGAEIGVHLGQFSQQILDKTSPKELHLIDPWEHHTSSEYRTSWYGGGAKGGQAEMDQRYASVCDKFAQNIRAGQVTVHRGYSVEILGTFPDGYLDWVYIDGNHLYDYVKTDLELAFRKVKEGGYILGDDYGEGGWWEGGVKKAVDEFVLRDMVRLVEIRNRQFVIRKVVN